MLEVTEHCVLRYQERVGPRPPKFPRMLPLSQCRADIEEALSRPPLFVMNPTAKAGGLVLQSLGRCHSRGH